MLIMTFPIAANSSRSKSCFEIQLIISINITEAKLFFYSTGFEPRTYGSAVQQTNHYTTKGFNIQVSHYNYEIGVKYCIC